MQLEVRCWKCEKYQRKEVSNLTLHFLNFLKLAAIIKKNFEELGI